MGKKIVRSGMVQVRSGKKIVRSGIVQVQFHEKSGTEQCLISKKILYGARQLFG